MSESKRFSFEPDSPEVADIIAGLVQSGRYKDRVKALNGIIREWQELKKQQQIAMMKVRIESARVSGVSDLTFDQIMDVAEHKASHEK